MDEEYLKIVQLSKSYNQEKEDRFKENSKQRLDLVVAGTQDAVMMVDSDAYQLSEKEMLGAVKFGHEQMQKVG